MRAFQDRVEVAAAAVQRIQKSEGK
jgi:hypothetical protein